MKLFTDRKIFKQYEWRGRVSVCPHCEKEPPGEYPYTEWLKKDWVDGIYLSIKMPNWKTDSFAVMSVCPICQKKSWLHQKLQGHFFGSRPDGVDGWPEKIKEAIVAEFKSRLHLSIDLWNASPCRLCTQINELDIQYLHFSRRCTAGSGPVLDKGEACKSRVEKKR